MMAKITLLVKLERFEWRTWGNKGQQSTVSNLAPFGEQMLVWNYAGLNARNQDGKTNKNNIAQLVGGDWNMTLIFP